MVDCISLFSGAGGLDIGAERAGAKIIRSVEFDHDAAETLRINWPGTRIEEADISTLAFSEHRSRRDPLILIGGPPCQPFSKNGYWVRNSNRLIERDPRNMLSEFLRAVSEAEPQGFLFENVESLLHPTNKEALRTFLAVAEGLGYSCTLYRANAADFGVPQKRKRVFVFGLKNGLAHIPAPQPTHSATPDLTGALPHQGVGKFIVGFDAPQYFEPSEITSEGTYAAELRHVPPGSNYIVLICAHNQTPMVASVVQFEIGLV